MVQDVGRAPPVLLGAGPVHRFQHFVLRSRGAHPAAPDQGQGAPRGAHGVRGFDIILLPWRPVRLWGLPPRHPRLLPLRHLDRSADRALLLLRVRAPRAVAADCPADRRVAVGLHAAVPHGAVLHAPARHVALHFGIPCILDGQGPRGPAPAAAQALAGAGPEHRRARRHRDAPPGPQVGEGGCDCHAGWVRGGGVQRAGFPGEREAGALVQEAGHRPQGPPEQPSQGAVTGGGGGG
mmetsp:Transcript_18294/g.35673  ORF Transcript_18294/g.35673 Transcript_18294/m.35673 type:complete len:237 (-) Transcript_18294:3-713(-)